MPAGRPSIACRLVSPAGPRSARQVRLATLCVVAAGLLLPGCREEEWGRPLQYEQGVYQGKVDEPLSSGQVESLRQRAQDQKF